MGKGSAPPPPDYSGIIAANEKTSEMAMKLAREQFDWAKQTYNENKGLTKETATSFLKKMEAGRIAAEEDRARYKQIYQPLEAELAAEARTYDTQERRDKEVGAAQAAVGQQFDAARDNAAQQLESFGVNPSATRFAALDLNMRASEAAAKAAAGTTAGALTEEKGRFLKQAAVDVGRGYPGQYTAAGELARASGATAAGTTQQAYGQGAEAMGTGPQWLGGANNAQANWANVLNMQYGNQLGQYNANASGGIGSILGLAAGIGMKAYGFQEGGAVPAELSPSNGGEQDDVPAAVSVGEFVVPKETVQWLGEKHFHKMIEKAGQEKAETEAVPAGPPPLPVYNPPPA